MKTVKKSRKILLTVTAVLLVIAAACGIYLADYYYADTEAIAAFAPAGTVKTEVLPDGSLVFSPVESRTGLIFYPGGKVEHTAYQPLMESLAAEGILCVLVEMPFRLAVLDMDAADGIPSRYPEIESWYIGGHSLGGAMASSYLADYPDAYSGLILLGSYSTADLTASGLNILSIYGSEDLVLDRDAYEKNRENLPDTFTEVVLPGGCHAGFGMYGPQSGDGSPAITNEEQIALTTEAIADFIFSAA